MHRSLTAHNLLSIPKSELTVSSPKSFYSVTQSCWVEWWTVLACHVISTLATRLNWPLGSTVLVVRQQTLTGVIIINNKTNSVVVFCIASSMSLSFRVQCTWFLMFYTSASFTVHKAIVLAAHSCNVWMWHLKKNYLVDWFTHRLS